MRRLHEGRDRQREINENFFILNDIVNGVEERRLVGFGMSLIRVIMPVSSKGGKKEKKR